jgi:hypothetical protein
VRSCFLLVLALFFGSCVGIRGGLLPELERDEILRGDRLPPISYDVDSVQGEFGLGDENERLFCDAFVAARRGTAADDLHVAIRFGMLEDHHVLAICSRAICLFSLGLIPAYSQSTVTLRARIESKGRLLREYHYADRITTWAHLLLLPWSYTSSGMFRVNHAVQANMLLHLIRDLRRDLPRWFPPEQVLRDARHPRSASAACRCQAPAASSVAVAAYNAGPGRVRRWRSEAPQRGADPDRWFAEVENLARRRRPRARARPRARSWPRPRRRSWSARNSS